MPARRHLAAIVIGVGLGGLFDGIVLHQILQWHHLVSYAAPPDDLAGLRFNLFVDGLFHQLMLLIALAGAFLLYLRLGDGRSAQRPPLLPGLLIGWGAFNVFDSVVFHWLLGLHNIRPGPDWLVFDLAFFGWGIAMLGIGWWVGRPAALARA